MAAALIRQTNSLLHGLAQPVQTVGMALTVLGLRPAAELLSAFITRHALQVHSPCWSTSGKVRNAGPLPVNIWAISSTALIRVWATALACSVIGMPVLVKAVRGYASTVTEALARKDRTFTQTENANHRTDHAVVGAIGTHLASAGRCGAGHLAAPRLCLPG